MNKFFSLTTLVVLLFVSCGESLVIYPEGEIVSKERELEGSFTKIQVNEDINVVYSDTIKTRCVIDANSNVMDYVETSVRDGILTLEYMPGIVISGEARIIVTVNSPGVNEFSIHRGSHLEFVDTLRVDKLSIIQSGGSKSIGEIDVKDLNVNLSGGSQAKLEGKANQLTLEGSGGSKMLSFLLNGNDANVSLSGGSLLQITMKEKISSRLSGGSMLYYKGTADVSDQDLTGGSKVISAN